VVGAEQQQRATLPHPQRRRCTPVEPWGGPSHWIWQQRGWVRWQRDPMAAALGAVALGTGGAGGVAVATAPSGAGGAGGGGAPWLVFPPAWPLLTLSAWCRRMQQFVVELMLQMHASASSTTR